MSLHTACPPSETVIVSSYWNRAASSNVAITTSSLQPKENIISFIPEKVYSKLAKMLYVFKPTAFLSYSFSFSIQHCYFTLPRQLYFGPILHPTYGICVFPQPADKRQPFHCRITRQIHFLQTTGTDHFP